MKIASADIYDCDLYPENPSWNPVILRLRSDDGIDGLGEVALAYGTGSAAGLGMLKQMVERFVIGADAGRIEQMLHTLYRQTFWGQGGGPVVYGALGHQGQGHGLSGV